MFKVPTRKEFEKEERQRADETVRERLEAFDKTAELRAVLRKALGRKRKVDSSFAVYGWTNTLYVQAQYVWVLENLCVPLREAFGCDFRLAVSPYELTLSTRLPGYIYLEIRVREDKNKPGACEIRERVKRVRTDEELAEMRGVKEYFMDCAE